MKYYSETLNKIFDDEKALIKAEKEYNDKIAAEKAHKEKVANERATRAKEVEEAYKAIAAAQKVYREKLSAFTKDYGSFHMTLHSGDSNPFNLTDIFDLFF